MERLPANLARQATIGVAPQAAWEVADAVKEEQARTRVPLTNQPTAPLRDPAYNRRWRQGESGVSIYLQTRPHSTHEGWSLVPVPGTAAQILAMQRLKDFEQHELSKVQRGDYFFRNPNSDATWINKQRLDDIELAIEAAHDHAKIAMPDETLADMQLRVMSKLFVTVEPIGKIVWNSKPYMITTSTPRKRNSSSKP